MVTYAKGSAFGRLSISTKLKTRTTNNKDINANAILLRVRAFLISSISSLARKYPFSFA